MSGAVPQGKTFSFLNKKQLLELKLKALRSGVWFKALRRIDRVLIDLTIRVAGGVRSIILAKGIFAVTRKLEGIMETRISRVLREIGIPLAQRLSLQGQKWGNTSAKNWASAPSLVNFLAVMHINHPKTFKP